MYAKAWYVAAQVQSSVSSIRLHSSWTMLCAGPGTQANRTGRKKQGAPKMRRGIVIKSIGLRGHRISVSIEKLVAGASDLAVKQQRLHGMLSTVSSFAPLADEQARHHGVLEVRGGRRPHEPPLRGIGERPQRRRAVSQPYLGGRQTRPQLGAQHAGGSLP